MSVLIISSETDQATNDVIRWIHHYGEKVSRINEYPEVKISCLDILSGKLSFQVGNEEISIDSIKSFWHRRDNFKIDFPKFVLKDDFLFSKELRINLQHELKKTNEFIHFKLLQKKSLGDFSKTDVNKLIVLECAKNVGIQIPETLITTSKEELFKFKDKHTEIICKAISEGILFSHIDLGNIYSYTSVVTNELYDKLPASFALSMFQNKIEKKYELRIFFLNQEFYAMAIFSQADAQTSIDFRKYNRQKPNRTVPFELPNELKDKLTTLMATLGLNTGSIDMAVTRQNEYIFFEVNPVGQFGMTSYPCNYYLERKIAEFLI